jgi:hypothetical protein
LFLHHRLALIAVESFLKNGSIFSEQKRATLEAPFLFKKKRAVQRNLKRKAG